MKTQRTLMLTLRHGIQLATRKGFMTFTSILVLSVAIIVVLGSVFMQALFTMSVQAVEKRVDMNVYMLPSANESVVTSLIDSLKKLPEVKQVELTSGEESLAQFKDRHSDDYLTLQALEELDSNPFGSVISVQANSPDSYETIARYLGTDSTALSSEITTSIEKVNFYENKKIIERLSSLNYQIRIAIFGIISISTVLAVLMVSAVVRSVVYSLREELALLKALGSSSAFIYGQFTVAFAIYSFFATAISIIIGYLGAWWADGHLSDFAPGVSLVSFLSQNIIQIVVMLFASACVIGWASSALSVYFSHRKESL